MNHAIELRLRAVEGSIIRTLGLAERRGFKLERVLVEQQAESQLLHLVVSSPMRSIEVLTKQLERLHDVIDVAINIDQSQDYSACAVSGG
ncbi:MAG: ACT domain-containing protein [Xanthomonadales bacterium]|nr:ACT domain-containing protein [Xanthomonadales bacterium]